MRISDWSSDVCSSDLRGLDHRERRQPEGDERPQRIMARPQRIGGDVVIAAAVADALDDRAVERGVGLAGSEERRVGKECVSTCRSRWSQYHEKKKNDKNLKRRHQTTARQIGQY